MRYCITMMLLLACEDKVTNITPIELNDADGDGFNAEDDCDDDDPERNPDAVEICDDIDNNCDGYADEGVGSFFYTDTDQDGFGSSWISIESCVAPPGFVDNNLDCNDMEPTANPLATEICDDIDNNCNGQIDENVGTTYYLDSDLDGYGSPDLEVVVCDPVEGFVLNNDDCDDFLAEVHPEAEEICDGIDNDCDGVIDNDLPLYSYYPDNDGDGYAENDATAIEACDMPVGYTSELGDCDDTTPDIGPDVIEINGDGIDNDCDGNIDGPSYILENGIYISADTYPGDFNAAGGFCTAMVGQQAYLVGFGFINNMSLSTYPAGLWVGNSSSSDANTNCSLYTSADSGHQGYGNQGGYGACSQQRHVVCSTDPNHCWTDSSYCHMWD